MSSDSVEATSERVPRALNAATVFADPHAVYLDDGSSTDRTVVIGSSVRDRVLCVVHVERGQRDRIISARHATRAERDVYAFGAPS